MSDPKKELIMDEIILPYVSGYNGDAKIIVEVEHKSSPESMVVVRDGENVILNMFSGEKFLMTWDTEIKSWIILL